MQLAFIYNAPVPLLTNHTLPQHINKPQKQILYTQIKKKPKKNIGESKIMIKVDELKEYIEEYIDEQTEAKNLTIRTIQNKKYNITQYIKYLTENNITELNDKNIKRTLKQYRSHCLNKNKNKRSTTKTYLTSIIDFLNYDDIQTQTQHQKIQLKNIIDVKKENIETARKRIEKISLNPEQTKFYLNTIQKTGNIRDYTIIQTFLDTGIRLNELVQLNKKDIKAPINTKGLYILPDNPDTIIEVHLRAETTKGKQKDRTTFITYHTLTNINQMIMNRLVDIRRRKKNLRIQLNPEKLRKEINCEELFTTIHGTRFTNLGVQDIVKKYAKLCDERIKKENINCNLNYYTSVSVHILRHTALSHYATFLTVAEVQAIAGHSNSATTDQYIHISHSHIKDKILSNGGLL